MFKFSFKKPFASPITRVVSAAIVAPFAIVKFFATAAEGGGAGKIKLGSLKGMKLGAKPLIDKEVNGKHYDVAVIGGGSGGIALAYEANLLGLKTVVFDYVEPSSQGSTWGLGGTCVNVGCIPKKLMHTAALHGENIVAAHDFGWDLDDVNNPGLENEQAARKNFYSKFNWDKLVKAVQTYIKSLNFGYKSELQEKGIAYVNALATLKDDKTVVFSPQKSSIDHFLNNKTMLEESTGKITADYIILAVGGRPNHLDEKTCKNAAKYSLTSDDLFSVKNPPNKTLVIGGGYIAVECAGFLSGLGYPVTLMTRSIFLRSFDRDMSDKTIQNLVEHNHVRAISGSLPHIIEKVGEKYKVKWYDENSKEVEDEFDTIFSAIGRTPNSASLNLNEVGVKLNHKSQKIAGGHNGEAERTSVPNIFAIGDNLHGCPELTPVAKKSGQLLAHRIALLKRGVTSGPQYDATKLDYRDIPTTVFTPLEYSCVGYNEEDAIKKFGKDHIEVYHVITTPLEEQLSTRIDTEGNSKKRKMYAKVICMKEGDQKVLGFHYIGPNSGEIMQPLAITLKMGVTKKILDSVVGIHPTNAEEFIQMSVTKSSGNNPERTSC